MMGNESDDSMVCVFHLLATRQISAIPTHFLDDLRRDDGWCRCGSFSFHIVVEFNCNKTQNGICHDFNPRKWKNPPCLDIGWIWSLSKFALQSLSLTTIWMGHISCQSILPSNSGKWQSTFTNQCSVT